MICPFCRARLEVSVERWAPGPIEPPPEPGVKNPGSVPWEDREELAGFLLTIRSALTSPASFFRKAGSASVGRAPSFALLILLPAITVQAIAFWTIREGAFDPEGIVRYAGLVALASMLSVAYLGAFYQLASSFVGRRRMALPGTVRALCFGFAPMVLAIVPFAGLAVGLSWSLILHAIALREVHGLTLSKSLAVVLAPVVLVAVRLW